MLAAGVLSLALLPGCGGCSGDDADANADGTQTGADKDKSKADKDKAKDKDKDKAKKDKEKEKPKPPPDFDPPRMAILPNDVSGKDFSQSILQGVKPGHWGSAVLEMKANNFDFSGELDSWLMNSRGEPLGLQGLPYQLASRRPAILPKGQKKYFEVAFFVPPLEEQKSPRLYTKLTTRGGGEVLSAPADPLVNMPAHQYYFIVLAREHDKYTFLKQLDSISPRTSEFQGSGNDAHYRVSIPIVDKRVPLPSHLLAWTSIAYVLWDDANPELLSEEQKNALIDWLHWGGQLIVSGPDSLASLQKPGSFLEPYLPATAGDSIKIDQKALADLNKYWSIHEGTANKNNTRDLTAVEPFPGVKLLPRAGTIEVPHTSDLFYERRVGRGRIVVSAFRLSQRELINWRSLDSFFNACLLGRPARNFGRTPVNDELAITWANSTAAPYDPAINTRVRFLGRDSFSPGSQDQNSQTPKSPVERRRDYNVRGGSFQFDGTDSDLDNAPASPGLGGWSDFNDVSNTARDSLRAAAGIEIPQASFVIWSLAAYLVVLVPVNWAFFKLLGRVEWAWFAAPVLAVAGTVFVTKMAHLDIGFTRSEREVALVELHAGHARAHVTRYTALYTSLSSSYQFAFDDPSAEVLPFSTDKNYQLLIGQGRSNVEFRQEGQVSLSGFEISSNSTGMIHSEHIVDLGGAIRVKGTLGVDGQIENGTKLNLASAGIVRKLHDGQLELGWIGDLPANGSKSIEKFKTWGVPAKEPLATTNADGKIKVALTVYPNPFFPTTNVTGDEARDQQWSKGLVLSKLAELLSDEKQFKNGDARLFAWTADEIPGAHSDPAAPQVRRASLVVAHLEYARLPAPRPDANLRPLKDAPLPAE